MYPLIHIVLPAYAVFACMGGLVILLFLYFRTEHYNFQFTDFIKFLITCVFYGFIGSRLVHILSRVPWLISNFSLSRIFSVLFGGGIVFYGGLLGVLFGAYRYSRKNSRNFYEIGNMIAPAIPLFHSFGRVGCFMAGCCYGIELQTPISLFGVFNLNRFPTQLIEAAFELILFVVIYFYQKKHLQADCLRLYMIIYAIFRFIIEFARGDAVRGVFLGVSTSQIIAVGIIATYFALAIKKKRNIKHQ